MNEVLNKKDTKSYYNKVTNLGRSLREFHNWIKKYLISNYLGVITSPECATGTAYKPRVLDVGCGRGGDILKFVEQDIRYVGFDPVENNLNKQKK